MKHLRRLFTLIATCGRYELQALLPAKLQKSPLLWVLKPFTPRTPSPLSRGERLRRACEELGPIFVKFGQLLSTRPDLIPEDICQALNHLQDNVAPFSSDTFIQIVEAQLGQPLHQCFAEFNPQPLASASIAQVHTATLHSGQAVVVKAVRPGILTIIEQDLSLLRQLAKWLAAFSQDGKRLKPVEVVEEYRTTLLDELDLMREAANAALLRRNFNQSPLLYVPEIHFDYCRSQVLVMERIYGAQVTDLAALKAAGVNMKALAERGVEIFFTQVFTHNFFHADMHPGNVFVSLKNPQQPQYIALDMAIMGALTEQDQYYLARNLLAMFRRDYHLVAKLHVMSGWVPPNTSVAALEAAIRTLCEPLFAKPLKDISFGQALLNLFQTARRFNMEVQPQLVLLQKTLLNIEGLGRQIYPDLDLWATAHPFLERWVKQRYSPKTLWRSFSQNAPDWLDQLPLLPQLALDTTQALKKHTQATPPHPQPPTPSP